MKRSIEPRRLVKVATVSEAPEILWKLMQEVEPHQAISHAKMPSWEEHVSFVKRYPFRVWYLIEAEGVFVGMISLSRRNEIGIRIFQEHQRKGHGSWAIRELVEKWGCEVANSGRPSVQRAAFIANINPANAASKALFAALGFHHAQDTFVLDMP